MAAGEELLDPGQDRVGIGEPGRVVRAVDLELPRARDVVGEVPAALHRNDGVVAGMDDQGWRGDRRQDRPDVDPERRFDCRPRHPRAGAHALQHRELAYRPDRRQQIPECRTAAPRRADGAAEFLQARDLLGRRRVVLTQLGYEARPQLGRVALDVVPPGVKPKNEYEPVRINARVRSGRVAAKTMAAGPPSLTPKRAALPKPTASMTASISAARSSSVRTCGTGSDSPTPALSNRSDATERGKLLHEGLEFGQGPEQLDVADERPREDELDRPVAEHLIRQAEIAARCVRRFRHGIERIDARRYYSRLWRNRAGKGPVRRWCRLCVCRCAATPYAPMRDRICPAAGSSLVPGLMRLSRRVRRRRHVSIVTVKSSGTGRRTARGRAAAVPGGAAHETVGFGGR